MQRKRTPRRLTYSVAFRAFDDIESAQTDVQGMLDLLSLLNDVTAFDKEGAESLPYTLERHLNADYAALKAAIGKARETILKPLHAQRAYDAPDVPEEAQAAAEGSSPVALVVDNEGGDHAA